MKTTLCLCIVFLCLGLAGCDNPSGMDSGPVANKSVAKANMKVQTLRPQALEIVKNSLHHDNAYIRRDATEVVSNSNCREMMPDILTLLKDPATAVRFAATLAIGDMRCFGYEKQVNRLLNDSNENVQLAAAYTLEKLNQPAYHEKVRLAAKSQDQAVRGNAVLLLGKLGNRDDLDLLYKVLHDEDSVKWVRLQAVEAIASLGGERMYRSKLWALLISKSPEDRVMGIRGMGALASDEAANAILTMLQDDVPEVRLTAAEQLGRLGDDRGEEEVFRYFENNPDLNTTNMANNMAVMAIGRIGSKRLQGFLPAALASQSEVVRLLAAQSILLLTQ